MYYDSNLKIIRKGLVRKLNNQVINQGLGGCFNKAVAFASYKR
jgi:hypothetical protein